MKPVLVIGAAAFPGEPGPWETRMRPASWRKIVDALLDTPHEWVLHEIRNGNVIHYDMDVFPEKGDALGHFGEAGAVIGDHLYFENVEPYRRGTAFFYNQRNNEIVDRAQAAGVPLFLFGDYPSRARKPDDQGMGWRLYLPRARRNSGELIPAAELFGNLWENPRRARRNTSKRARGKPSRDHVDFDLSPLAWNDPQVLKESILPWCYARGRGSDERESRSYYVAAGDVEARVYQDRAKRWPWFVSRRVEPYTLLCVGQAADVSAAVQAVEDELLSRLTPAEQLGLLGVKENPSDFRAKERKNPRVGWAYVGRPFDGPVRNPLVRPGPEVAAYEVTVRARDGSPESRFFLFDKDMVEDDPAAALIGYLSLTRPAADLPWVVFGAAAVHGYGPLLYDLAATYHGERIYPSMERSRASRSFWKKQGREMIGPLSVAEFEIKYGVPPRALFSRAAPPSPTALTQMHREAEGTYSSAAAGEAQRRPVVLLREELMKLKKTGPARKKQAPS